MQLVYQFKGILFVFLDFLIFFICTRGWETPLAMLFQRSGQLVCQFKGTNRFLFLFFVFIYIYIYKGVGDSSGNAIPEEWAASLSI